MSQVLKIGLSPCPNDTFIFHALLNGLVAIPHPEPVRAEGVFADVETLNSAAAEGRLPITKISVGALPDIIDKYALLSSGGALGWGCGPLVVARSENFDPASARVAIPGRRTTANLLLDMTGAFAGTRLEMPFNEVMPAVASGEADLGVVIHEGRFTFQGLGLIKVVDLGQWWEEKFHTPLPLGAIAVRRDVPPALAQAAQDAIRQSVEFAWSNPQASRGFVMERAQEMDEGVARAHIQTFVTPFSRDLGEEGRAAIELMLKEALRRRGRAAPPQIFIPAGAK